MSQSEILSALAALHRAIARILKVAITCRDCKSLETALDEIQKVINLLRNHAQ